jgi:transcriptional regulator with XRE-family HTH domain
VPYFLPLPKPGTMTEKTIHEGRNVKRIREILGIKQDALAIELGLSQQAISALEQKEALDKDMLEKVAKALKISPEAIKNYDHETSISNIQNNYDGSVVASQINYQFNASLTEALEENKKLYVALLKEKDEKIALLEKMLANKK